MIQLTIPGKPIVKKRPRFSRRGNHVTTYSDQKLEVERVRGIVRHQLRGAVPIEGAILLQVLFCMPIPKSTSKKKRKAMINDDILHIKRPDLDNLEKFISDCLNGLVWKDDSQIVSSKTSKCYSEEPRTEIQIDSADKYDL